MSLSATLKRARKAVKAAALNSQESTNKLIIHKETDEFDTNPAGALVIILKDLEMDSSEAIQEAV